MGKDVGNSALSVGSGGLLGNNPLTRAMGLSGEQGEYFQGQNQNQGLDQLNDMNATYNNGALYNAQNAYANGGSLQDALGASKDLSGTQRNQFENMLATGVGTSNRYATDQIQSNPVLGQLFGKGGSFDRANAEEQQLASRGFSMQPEDYEAYGQASGNIARQFGQSEQNLSQALASRGLGSSGAAQVQFSGLMGNKNEQLAASQRKIADDRMNNNLQRLNSTRNYMQGLGQDFSTDLDKQVNRNMASSQQMSNNLQSAAKLGTANNAQVNQANLDSETDKRDAKGQTLFSALGNGLFQGVQGAAKNGVQSAASGGAGA